MVRPDPDRHDVAAGRHAAPAPPPRRRLLRVGLAAAVGVGTLAFASTTFALTRGADGNPCPTQVLDVLAAPQVAPVVAAVAAARERATGCAVADVTATEPVKALARLTERGAARPDVWVPDSSIWLDRAATAGVRLPGGAPSLATSPVVLAAAPGSPAFDAYVAAQAGARLGLPSPRTSSVALGVLLAVQDVAAARPEARLVSTGTLRAAALQTTGGSLAERLAGAGGVAVPATAQEVTALEAARPGSARAVPLPAGSLRLDYPWAVLADDAATVAKADALLADLRDEGRAALAAAGFDAPTDRAQAGVPAAQAADTAARTFDVVRAPSRMLAVIDVSGSMGLRVPGAGGATRIDLVRDGALRGLDLFPDDNVLGLWAFSTYLTPTSDHVELVPLQPLGAGPDGTTGRQRLLTAMQGVRHVPGGGTALYDTALAAVRAVRATYDPSRVNSVVLLSDGRNDDDKGLKLNELLATLQREVDHARPVPVIAIAYGPDSDAEAMTAISRVTGGATYLSKDPRDVRRVFLDAVGQRTCRPSC